MTSLVKMHPEVRRNPGGGRQDRWANVLRDYRQIRRLVTDNNKMCEKTTIQLFDVNRHTLVQWHNKAERRREVQSLEAGIGAPDPPMTTKNLPPPASMPLIQAPGEGLPQLAPQGTSVTSKRRKKTEITPDFEGTTQPFYFVPTGEGIFRFQQIYTPTVTPFVPHPGSILSHQILEEAQERTKKRVRVSEEERVHKRRKTFNTCTNCGQPKIKETGHKGFKGNSFCPESRETYKEFLKKVAKLIEQKKSYIFQQKQADIYVHLDNFFKLYSFFKSIFHF